MQLYKLHSHLIRSHLHLIMSHNFSLSFNVGPNHFSFAFNSVSKNSCLQFHVFIKSSRYSNESGTVTKEHIEGLARLREEAKKKRELKKQKQKEWAKRQESENNNTKIENHTNSQKDKKKSIYSNKNNYQKVKKLEINQDNLGNIKFTNSKKPKLGIKV